VLEREIQSGIVSSLPRSQAHIFKNRPGVAGMPKGFPDLTVVLPGEVIFVEVKQPGKKPTKIQEWWHKRLRTLGATVLVVDSEEQFIKEVHCER
jgi:hypothetical protein